MAINRELIQRSREFGWNWEITADLLCSLCVYQRIRPLMAAVASPASVAAKQRLKTKLYANEAPVLAQAGGFSETEESGCDSRRQSNDPRLHTIHKPLADLLSR